MRTCIYTRQGIEAIPLYDYCSRDLTTVKINEGIEGKRKYIILSSAYLPYEEADPVNALLHNLVNNCANENLIIGCDANAHHVAWGSTDNNKRGEVLMDYLVSSPLFIMNKGNRPTFVNKRRAEVIDITLATKGASKATKNWHVSGEISLSDHNYICFRYETTQNFGKVLRRNPRKTNWASFKEDLKVELRDPTTRLNSIIDIEFEADRISQAVKTCWIKNCPEKEVKSQREPWWSPDLEHLRQDTRKVFNYAKSIKDFTIYAKALTHYSKQVRKAKRRAWRDHCQNISSYPEGMRLPKAMSSAKVNILSSIRNDQGKLTTDGKETLAIMLKKHFPDSVELHSVSDNIITMEEQNARTSKDDWRTAKKVVDADRIRWAIRSFRPYKSPGPDGIYPILLQEGRNIILPHLCRLYRACIAFGYVPTVWRQVKVIFIPKPGKADYEDAKSYRPISLTSFFLKALEKMIDRHIRDGALKRRPLHKMQCAYQQGKSTETALHYVVDRAERALATKEISAAAFLDIEGAFDRTTFESISAAAERHGIEPTIIKWTNTMLQGRIIQANLLGDKIAVKATKGCPQGGVLSPILWSLVVDSLLVELNIGPFHTVGYADDIVIQVNGKFPNTVSDLLQEALDKVEGWCDGSNLSINPSKSVLVPFTNKADLSGLKELKMYGTKIEWATEVKYLGVTLDKKLTWRTHVENATKKALRVFNMCRSAYGKTWGLKPRVIYWIYTMMVRPILTYGSAVWWTRTLLQTCKDTLRKVQRVACMGITGAFKTTPTMALEWMLNIKPLHIHIQTEARKSHYRLARAGAWNRYKPCTKHTSMDPVKELDDLMDMTCDADNPVYMFNRRYSVHIPTREEWQRGLKPINDTAHLIWYTDGSKMKSGTGAGIWSNDCNISQSMGQYTSVFQSESYAIIVSIKEMLRRNVKEKTVYILSDSQAALKALISFKVNSKLVKEGVILLNKLGKHNNVKLIWVPGHEGVEGNEKADQLARAGSSKQFIGPEPFVGIPQGTYQLALHAFADKEHVREWRQARGLNHSKTFCSTRLNGCKRLLNLTKTHLRHYIGAMTGHFGTKEHLHRMKLSTTDTCRFCMDNQESMQHILCSCDALGRRRAKHLGVAYPLPDDFARLQAGMIAKYLQGLLDLPAEE